MQVRDVISNGTSKTARNEGVFLARNAPPIADNKYYIYRGLGGLNGAPLQQGNSVLPNCVGYAWGRFNEIMGSTSSTWKAVGGDAKNIFANAVAAGWPVSLTPSIGAIAVWAGEAGKPVFDPRYGHVAIVEDIESEDRICVSESNWTAPLGSVGNPGCGLYFGYGWINPKNFGNLIGYVINPATAGGNYKSMVNPEWMLDYANSYKGGAYSYKTYKSSIESKVNKSNSKKSSVVYEDYETEIKRDSVKTITEDNLHRTKFTSLLSTPTLVETPFIIVKIGEYTFGNCSKVGDLKASNLNITFPNYMKSITITKVNGSINTYNIVMEYQIREGDDPNLLDRIFSSVGHSMIKISYGDWSSPTFIYKEEEALITKLTSNVDFGASKITYTLACTSNSLSLLGLYCDFPATTAKPSDIIKDLLYNNSQYGLLDVFYGMKNKIQVDANGLILSDDKVVEIQAKRSMDPLSYINYLVSCMVSNTNSGDSVLHDSSYFMSIYDNLYGENNLEGPYFKISKVTSNTKTIDNTNTYEVDVGYPTDNLVTEFKLNDDNSWALLYKYADQVNINNYKYKLNNEGKLVTEYSPSISTSSTQFQTTEAQKTWWTKMTQFPVTATLTLKGLVRPAMLMTYIRINALFFGQRHVSSGLYFITKQVDTINGNGYKTTLTLTRIAGDTDYIETEEKKITTKVKKYVS